MSLLDKIKIFFEDKQDMNEDKTTIEESISIDELPNRLENKTNELTELKKQLKDKISQRISSFKNEINEKINILENIDISQRKEYDRIKIIVENNLNLYISHLRRIIEDIENIRENDTEIYLNKLSYKLNEFIKISAKPFEKATILVGKELSETKIIIKLFLQDINKIVEDSQSILEKSKISTSLNDLLSESRNLALLHVEIETKLSEIRNTLKKSEIEYNLLKNNLSVIKEGEDFKKDNLSKADYKNKLDSLEKEIQLIKNQLNLKSLLKKFHNNKEIDLLVRRYMSDFKDALKEDEEIKIVDIIDDRDKYFIQLKKIKETMTTLQPLSPTKIDLEIAFLEEKIKQKEAQMLDFQNNIRNEIKRKDKISIKLEKTNSDIVENSKFLLK